MSDDILSKSAEENRRRFPEVAAFVDAVRKHWPDAQVTYLGASKLQPATDGAQGPAQK